MRLRIVILLMVMPVAAEDCRALVEGAGCRTRQLAMQRIWEAMPRVTDVEILPREQAPAANHRWFVIRAEGDGPDKDALIKALGRRAKHYHVVRVEELSEEESSGR